MEKAHSLEMNDPKTTEQEARYTALVQKLAGGKISLEEKEELERLALGAYTKIVAQMTSEEVTEALSALVIKAISADFNLSPFESKQLEILNSRKMEELFGESA